MVYLESLRSLFCTSEYLLNVNSYYILAFVAFCNMLSAICHFYSTVVYKNISLSIGIKKEDFERLDRILKEFSFIKFICVDVANGYSEHFSASDARAWMVLAGIL